MPGQLTSKTRDGLLDSLGLKFIQLHSAEPTATGTVGVVADTAVDFSAKLNKADQGAIQTNGSIEIPVTVTAGQIVVSHYSLWAVDPRTATQTDLPLATGSLAAAQTYTASGKYIVNTLTVDLNK